MTARCARTTRLDSDCAWVDSLRVTRHHNKDFDSARWALMISPPTNRAQLDSSVLGSKILATNHTEKNVHGQSSCSSRTPHNSTLPYSTPSQACEDCLDASSSSSASSLSKHVHLSPPRCVCLTFTDLPNLELPSSAS